MRTCPSTSRNRQVVADHRKRVARIEPKARLRASSTRDAKFGTIASLAIPDFARSIRATRWDTVDTATPNAQKLAIPVVLLGAVPPGVPPTVPWDTWDSGRGIREPERFPALGSRIEFPQRLLIRFPYSTTLSLTFATPRSTIPSDSAAECETSTMRPGTNGPRSLTRTVTDCPVAMLVTRTRVPNGSVR
jgi:hypothetical protein